MSDIDISIKDLLFNSPHYFIYKVFGFRVDGMHGRIINHLIDNKYALVLAPRGHGKSKMVQGVITWLIVNNPNTRVIIVSDTDTKAQMFLRTIKAIIENSPIIHEYYGDLKGDRWTDHAITIKGRDQIHTEPSLLSVGAGSGSVTGMHGDFIMIDDIVSYDSSRGEMQRSRIKDWYKTTLLPVLLSSGSIGICGTRYHFHDYYDMIINDLQYPTMILPAINEDGTALCDWLVPLEDRIGINGKVLEKGLLSIKKDLGSVIFALQYANNVDLLKEGNIFHHEWIQYYDKLSFDGAKVSVLRGTSLTEIKKVIIGVDLAISKKESADYTVVTVVGQGEDKKLYVLDVISGHLSYNQQKSAIRGAVERWNPIQTIIESVAYQAAIIDDLRSEGGLRIKPYKTTTDKVSRAMGMSGYFENGNIFFRKNMENEIDSLLLFPDGIHDDFVDSLGFAISGFKQSTGEMVVMEM